MSSSQSSRSSSTSSGQPSAQPSARTVRPPADDGGAGTDSTTPRSAASRLFDIRLLIGGLFLLYGVMLTVAGFTTSTADRAKAAGININLWMGIGMLVVGALFVLWLRLKPLRPEEADPAPTASGGAAGR